VNLKKVGFLGEKWNFEKKSFNVDVLACVGG
jgi:hypothetical protein